MTNALQPADLFTQMFTVEILTTPPAAPAVLATSLSANIIAWEREFNEEDEEDDDSNFLVPDSDDDAGDEDDDGDDHVDDEDGEEGFVIEEPSDSTLSLTTHVNAAVLADIKALQAMNADERILVRIVYGTEEAKLVRQFTVSPELSVLLSDGAKDTDEPLLITLVADVYDSETIF